MQLCTLTVYVYLGNTWVCSRLWRSAWLDLCSARLCWALWPARQPEGKQRWCFLSKRAGEKKENRLLRLSGRSNKALSTAVRVTQGDLPDSISLTLFSVPKPNSWHVKTWLPKPGPVQVSCWSCKVLSTPEQSPRNLFVLTAKWIRKYYMPSTGTKWTAVSIAPVFTVTLWCLRFIYLYFLWWVLIWGALLSAQGKALTWNYVIKHLLRSSSIICSSHSSKQQLQIRGIFVCVCCFQLAWL